MPGIQLVGQQNVDILHVNVIYVNRRLMQGGARICKSEN
jgi:hypothetical protein